jgi:predicted MFS family arabinose efflux permease
MTRHEDNTHAPIMDRPLALLFLASLGSGVSFYLLLSVVPLYAVSLQAGRSGAGATTAALMLSTVFAELATPRLIRRFGNRVMLATGLVLLGLPALALIDSPTMAIVLAASLVRGLGFGVVVVLGSALVAELAPPARQGEALGLYGIVVGVPAVIALPLGVWLTARVGFEPVFIVGAIASLLGLVVVGGLPIGRAEPEQASGIVAGFRTPSLVRLSIVFATTAMAAGVVVTFLPLAVALQGENLAAIALLAHAVAATASRWWAGRYGDRHGSSNLVIPSVILVAVGIFAIAVNDSPATVLAGMVAFGTGFGVAQNSTLALMIERVPASRYGTVSAMWNLSYDVGLGLGAAAFGVVAARTGYAAAFGITAVLVLGAIGPSLRDRSVRPDEARAPDDDLPNVD